MASRAPVVATLVADKGSFCECLLVGDTITNETAGSRMIEME